MTLLYGARSPEVNHAVVLARFLGRELGEHGGGA